MSSSSGIIILFFRLYTAEVGPFYPSPVVEKLRSTAAADSDRCGSLTDTTARSLVLSACALLYPIGGRATRARAARATVDIERVDLVVASSSSC